MLLYCKKAGFTLISDTTNESYCAVLPCDTVYYAVQGCSSFWICGWNPKVWPFKWKLLSVVLFLLLYKVVLASEAVHEILKCNHSNESYWAVLSCGAVYYTVQGGSNFWVGDKILNWGHSNDSYPSQQFILVELVIVLFTSVLPLYFVDENLKCDHLHESYKAVILPTHFCVENHDPIP